MTNFTEQSVDSPTPAADDPIVVLLRVHLRPRCRRFVVKDTGQGVDLAEIDTLFEAFTDLHRKPPLRSHRRRRDGGGRSRFQKLSEQLGRGAVPGGSVWTTF